MEDPLVTRKKIIEKLLLHMKECQYKDEQVYLTLRAQATLKDTNFLVKPNSGILKEQIKRSSDYSDVFNEIELVQSIKGDICCMTQMKIKDRWTNHCGHVYERVAVMAYKKKNHYCPAVGCTSRIKEINE